MIDDSDGDVFWVLSLVSRGWWALAALAVAVLFWIIAARNSADCRARTCPPGSVARLMDHECLCVVQAPAAAGQVR